MPDTGALGGQPEARALENRLGHPVGKGEGDREQGEQDDVRQHARRRPELDQGRRDEDAEADTGCGRDAVGEPDTGGVAARMQVEKRRAGRAQRGTGRETLKAAGDEQPRG